ncbi:MAG: hypothetical protein ACFHU9_13180 [Fluviicola sp.]
MKARMYVAGILSGVFFLLLSLTSVIPNSNKANVTIPAKQEFVLGEEQQSSYKAKLKNAGTKTIQVNVLDKITKEQKQEFELQGSQVTTVSVQKSEIVLLQNPNNEEVLVEVKLSKSVQGMRYQEVKAFDK